METPNNAEQRYFSKRRAGISTRRKDGTSFDPRTDKQSGAAEKFVCDYFNSKYNSEIYDTHGDAGFDFKIQDYEVEVVHLGMVDNFTKPRMTGNLLVNPHEPWRWAHIYIVVRGSIETGFEILGWTTHTELVAREQQDFSYGKRFWMPIGDLAPIEPLLEAALTFRREYASNCA